MVAPALRAGTITLTGGTGSRYFEPGTAAGVPAAVTVALVAGARMRSFWDRRAREDAFYFVDNRLRYGRADPERLWAAGEADLRTLLGLVGVAIRPSDSIVEIGCGVGRLTRALAARAGEVTAVDLSERMLARARRENPHLHNVEWLLGDGSTLAGIADGSADACVSHVVFQHIPDPAITLGYVREMGRVLRSGGWSAFQFSNDPSVHRPPSLHGRLRAGVSSLLGRGPRGQGAPAWRGSAVELADLEDAAEDGGMRLERVTGAGSQFCVVLARRA